jgi:signal-transduction protein with cAMP-binding, CBS, and nucleotidyltransferase domain
MKVSRVFTRNALATTRSASVAEAAAAMRRYHVGALLVMEDPPSDVEAIGIVTDRDLAMQALTVGSPEGLLVGDVMTPVVATVSERADVHEALEVMRAHGVRRLVVTGRDGAVEGLVSIDDIVDGLAVDLAAAAAVLKGEIRRDSGGLGDVRVAA